MIDTNNINWFVVTAMDVLIACILLSFIYWQTNKK